MKDKERLIVLLENPRFREFVFEKKHEQYWNTWLIANPDDKGLLEMARMIVLELRGENWNEERKGIILQKIKSSINDQKYLSYKKRNRICKTYLQSTFFLCLFFGLLYLLVNFIIKTPENLSISLSDTSEIISKNTPFGQKSRIVLPDGSAATLNSGSEIRYNKEYGSTNREIVLNGEGFFEVAKDSLMSFKVITHEIEVIALGTSFNVRSFLPNQTVVQLASGKVKVGLSNQGNYDMELLPGEQASFSGDGILKKSAFEISKAFKWREGVLIFNSASWKEVILELERWYGVTFEVKGELPVGRQVSAEFNRDFLSNVLSSLSYTFDFEYSINKNHITIKFN